MNLGGEWYGQLAFATVVNHVEPLLVVLKDSNTIPACKELIKTKEFKNLKQNERINAWKNKAICGQYLIQMNGKDIVNTIGWLKKSNLKGCTEVFICNAQEASSGINYIKFLIDKTIDSPLCRMFGNKNETV